MARRPIWMNVVLALATITSIGVIGYMAIAGMTFIEALYMTVTTLSTVGYGEVRPLDTAGRVFTMLLIVGGLGLVFYSASRAAADVIEGGVRRALGRRRVQRQIAQMTDHFIVCGFGRIGRIVCKELAAKPVPFVVVERDADVLRYVEAESLPFVEGDATEDDVLLAAGISRARGLIAALSSDSSNVYVVLTARELNSNLLVVARAEDERSERKLLHAGATRVVSPYVIGGHRMAQSLIRPAVVDVIDLATHYRSMELQIEEVSVAAGTFAAGATVAKSKIRERSDVILIAIKRANDEMIFNPASDVRIEPGDRLVLMGQRESLRELEQQLRKP